MTPTRIARQPSRPGRLRRAGRLALLAGVAVLGACSWLEAEFSALDRLPPSAATPVDALPSPAERP